jgi:hypothetical protein
MKNIKNNHCNINKRHEEINKNYLMDTEKAFKLEKRIELQHITFLRKKKQKQKLEKVILKKKLNDEKKRRSP